MSALETDWVIEGVRAVMICCTRAASLVEDKDWAFIVVSRFWLLPWKLLLLPWNLEVVVLLP